MSTSKPTKLCATDAFLHEINMLSGKPTRYDPDDSRISVRMFSLNGGKTVFAYLFDELDDSFIVGQPSLLGEAEGASVAIAGISPTPVVRLYKSSIYMSAVPPLGAMLKFLLATRAMKEDMKGYFTKERLVQVDSLIHAISETVSPGTPRIDIEGALKVVSKKTYEVGKAAESEVDKEPFYVPKSGKTTRIKH
jgi:hypothetical protein